MTSKALANGAFIVPKSSAEETSLDITDSTRRNISVYDAVAGRISAAGFIRDQVVVPSTRDTTSSSTTALPPEAVLFRSSNAPTRYAESDIYFSNKRAHLAELPESDLLKALHCYISDFYSRAAPDAGIDDWKSLDETALIALGILIEEAVLSTLGEAGDMVFTEGEITTEPQPAATSMPVANLQRLRRFKKRRVEDQR